jgi:hypothetical protein
MSDAELFPRVRSAVRVDAREPVHSVTLGDSDLQFKGVPNALLKDVISRFNGRASLESICAVYPDNVAPVVKLIASQMQERRMLLSSRRSKDSWDVEASPGAQSTWAYISDRVPDPTDAFRRWRGEPILVCGRGRSFRQAVAGLISAGAGQLRIGAEEPADRQELEARLALQAASDRGFRYDWVASAPEADAAMPFLRIVDGDLFDDAGDWAEAARSHRGPRILAGVSEGWGIVLRVPAAGEAARPLLPTPVVGRTVPVSDYALAVLGSMAAFQALNVVMMDRQAEQHALVPLSDKVLIRPDGGLYVSDPADPPAPVPEPGSAAQTVQDGVRSPHQRERERWIGSTSPFFAPTAPLLSWQDEMPLPAFPLAHRALSVLPGHGTRERVVIAWALWPSEITALALQRGLEALADELTGAGGHTVGLQLDDWSTSAFLSWAEARAPAELLGSSPWRLHYEDSDDVRFRTLVRLINLYLGAPPTIEISLDGRSGAPRADVRAGEFHRFALGSSALQAAVEALGRTLSGVQLGEAPGLAPRNPAGPILACPLGLAEEAALDPGRLGLAPRLLNSLGDVPIAGFVVGRYARADGDD